jgi:hypothetical protein
MVKSKWLVVVPLLGAVLSGLLMGLAAPSRADEGKGFSPTMLQLQSTGAVNYDGSQVWYLLCISKSPSAEQTGVMVAFAPPVDLVRGADGRPLIVTSDPHRGGDYQLDGPDGRKVAAGPADIAQAVQDGRLPPDAPVSVTLELRLHDSEGLRKKIYEAARSQLTRPLEQNGGAAPRTLSSGDWERINHSVTWPTVRDFRVTVVSDGLQDVTFKGPRNPQLRDRMRLQARVPALFLSKLYSGEGVELSGEFELDIFHTEGAQAKATKTVNDVLNEMIRESSLGHLKFDDRQGTAEILATREQAQKVVRNSKWKESIQAWGSDREMVNAVLQLAQRQDADVFKVTEDQFQAWLKEHALTLENLRAPGMARTLEALASKDQFSDRDVESFASEVKARQSHSEGGGGFSLFGVVGVGGHGGSGEASAEGSKRQNRQALQQFVKDLNTYRRTGEFPVPPSGRYSLISKQAIVRGVEQNIGINVGGPVKTMTLSSPFSSVRPTLTADAAPAKAVDRNPEETLRLARRELRHAEQVVERDEQAEKDAGKDLQAAKEEEGQAQQKVDAAAREVVAAEAKLASANAKLDQAIKKGVDKYPGFEDGPFGPVRAYQAKQACED